MGVAELAEAKGAGQIYGWLQTARRFPNQRRTILSTLVRAVLEERCVEPDDPFRDELTERLVARRRETPAPRGWPI
jgi:hypothetical protein